MPRRVRAERLASIIIRGVVARRQTSASTADLGVIWPGERRVIPDDPLAKAVIELLEREGAGGLRHGRGRTLLDHLVATYAVVRRWGQPAWLQRAALIHSVYGTDAFRSALLPLSQRDDVIEVAGERAERLAYLFSVTPRGPLLAGTHLWARDLPTRTSDGARAEPPATRGELDALVLLHMANLAEQARADDGAPARWLVKLRDLAELLVGSEAIEPPPFTAGLATVSEAEESRALSAYQSGLTRADDAQARADRLAVAAATCAAVGEPCVWLAYLAGCRDDAQTAGWWAGEARKRLEHLGTSWDKRLTYDEWLQLSERLQAPVACAYDPALSDPRALYRALTRGSFPDPPAADPVAGRKRFQRYVEDLGHTDGRIYPELASEPWFDPRDFPLARYLESNFAAIRAEILAVDQSRFHRESEPIQRSGDWDVAFFYERGRRRDELCDACPVTTRGIESYPAIRTQTGLIYISRMRAGTHIQPHRGPTNLRVRCHLGIHVPDGDCAIRVAGESRRWEQGRCLVFDDYFEHEAWNHTGADRIVLIVDLWHPGLSATEIALLEGLHRYSYLQAGKLSRYWKANAEAARGD